MVWSSVYNQGFKVKVRHIITRLIRKFGFDVIHKLTPSHHYPLLDNIEKRLKRRSKKTDSSRIIDGKRNYEEFINTTEEDYSEGEEGVPEVEHFVGEEESDVDEVLEKAIKRTLSLNRKSTKKQRLIQNIQETDDDYDVFEEESGKLKIMKKGTDSLDSE